MDALQMLESCIDACWEPVIYVLFKKLQKKLDALQVLLAEKLYYMCFQEAAQEIGHFTNSWKLYWCLLWNCTKATRELHKVIRHYEMQADMLLEKL